MVNEKILKAITEIERALGKVEGVAFTLEDKYSIPLLDAVELLDSAVKEITDGK